MRSIVGLLLFGLLGISAPVAAQNLTPEQIEALRQNPALLIRQLQAMGMTPEQLRQRLQSLGFQPGVLDDFLAAGEPLEPAFDQQMLRALEALGIDSAIAAQLELVPVAVGLQRRDTTLGQRAERELSLDSLLGDTTFVEPLELFGLDLFRRSPLFLPDLSGPVPANYRLAPGDKLALILTGDVELVRELVVTREGFVVIENVGQIAVNNLTMEEFRALLRQRLARSYSGIRSGTTVFTVTVTELHTNQVIVTGEVQQPSAYRLASLATALHAIYAAGGLTENANFRQIEIRRGGQHVATLDLYDILLRGSTENDVTLQQGDVVFVPVHGTRASISGAVVRPAIYELKSGETLQDLLSAAGGFRADAARRRILISRVVPPDQRGPDEASRTFVDVALNQNNVADLPPFTIEPGDSAIVDSIPVEARRGFVEVRGAVYNPGTFGWRPGLRLSDVISMSGGVRPAVYSGVVHVERLNPFDSTRYLVRAELPDTGANGNLPEDPELREYDVVTIYGRAMLREERTVHIGGMVHLPGEYAYRDGMTLRDALLMAGGFRDGASLDTAEIARLPADRSGGVLAQTYRVPLDSTYLFDNSTYPLLPGPAIQANGAPEFELAPFDEVTVLKQPDFDLQRRVVVMGEVRYPGPYALTRKDERISDLVERAGGFLSTAYQEGARFYRSFQIDSLSRVGVDLTRAIRDRGSDHDVVLQPGDSLHIPEFLPTVQVNGAVIAPSTVLYRPGAGLEYYIDNAGGYARYADKSRVSVQFANGSISVKKKRLFWRTSPTPGPGSTVLVPSIAPGEGVSIAQVLGPIAQVVAALTTIVVVATR